MIDRLRIVNFKSHKDTILDFKNLTVICGQNGVGKSSTIQSLLLLRQTYNANKLDKILSLNGDLCNLGTAKDAIYQFNDEVFKDDICFEISDSTEEYSWVFNTARELDFLDLKSDLDDAEGFKENSLFKTNFQYISASRIAEYKSNDFEVLTNKQLSLFEGKGELTAHFLYKYGKSIAVDESLLHSNESDSYLLSQTTAWEKEISKGVNIVPVKTGDNYDIKYSFDVPSFGPTQEFSSKNVGFGLSYTLPIIVAILSAQPGALIIIENPEAHLHPNGIAKLTELICLAAQAGIQIIIETHSDHIVNGILVQSKKFEETQKGIDKDNVSIYQFDRDEKEHCTVSIKVEVEEGGRISFAPEGFFDQDTIDTDFLLGL